MLEVIEFLSKNDSNNYSVKSSIPRKELIFSCLTFMTLTRLKKKYCSQLVYTELLKVYFV